MNRAKRRRSPMWAWVLLAPTLTLPVACERPSLIDDQLTPGDGDGDGDVTGDGDGHGDGPRAVDILLIVDNSGSMCEEQALLVDSFFDEGCPFTDLVNVPTDYQDADDATLAELSADCGFMQLMAAAGVDARVGVLSTDVGPCDNRFDTAGIDGSDAFCGGAEDAEWGRRPQRGCLMGAPTDDRRFIDMTDDNAFEHFSEMIDALGVYGSAFERGFDQVEAFLDEDTADGCPNTASDFLRPGADLVLAFMSDEDDCSHAASDMLPDENLGESCANTVEEPWPLREPAVDPIWCYERDEALRPVNEVADMLSSWADAEGKRVSVASIAGGVYEDGRDEIVSTGCLVDDNGKPDGTCTPSFGNSNLTAPGFPCNEDVLDGQPPCCSAEAGTRYQALANAFGDGLNDSICYSNYRSTLLEVARLAAGR